MLYPSIIIDVMEHLHGYDIYHCSAKHPFLFLIAVILRYLFSFITFEIPYVLNALYHRRMGIIKCSIEGMGMEV